MLRPCIPDGVVAVLFVDIVNSRELPIALWKKVLHNGSVTGVSDSPTGLFPVIVAPRYPDLATCAACLTLGEMS